ncbi:DNA-binding IclR family transcriptional regulator [Microbacterium testaceum]|uniref:IclR family transcriptional regulator n=1 Tax=Microbacterium testaceum TaxID=2033 RepID=UPI002781E588|nr:IclR family transcriptional regulator [Microbacterium testaceum]MDQ1174426.1 DNA-binding IclR family transcriptional regulator [Microbacterium testaceum]
MSDDDVSEIARDPAPAVGRSIRLLGLLAEAGRTLTLTELAAGLGLAKSSTANICLSLEAARMIERVPLGYRLGIRTAELGGAFAAQFNQVREFYAVCESSPVLAAELVQVAVLDDADALYLARYEGSRSIRMGTPLGSRLPAALSATGRALLMTRTDDDVRALLTRGRPLPKLTDHSTLDVDAVIAKIAASRERGWSVDEEESFRGIVGVAVPLEGWAPGDPQLALGVGLPVADATPQRIARVGAALREAAAALTNPFSASRGR